MNRAEPVFNPQVETPPEFRTRIEGLDKLLDAPEAWLKEAESIMEDSESLPDFEMYVVVKPIFRVGFPEKYITDPENFPKSVKENKEECGEYLEKGIPVGTAILFCDVFQRIALRMMAMPEVMGEGVVVHVGDKTLTLPGVEEEKSEEKENS